MLTVTTPSALNVLEIREVKKVLLRKVKGRRECPLPYISLVLLYKFIMHCIGNAKQKVT